MKRLLLLVTTLLFIFVSCTIVKHKDKTENSDVVNFLFDNGEFDASAYAFEKWESQILPAVKGKAIDINMLVKLLKDNPKSASSGAWALQTNVTAPINYMVSGSGKISAVHTESAASTIEVQLETSVMTMQIGPIIKYTSIRDCMDFIHFQDFTNQLEYSNVSTEINKIVQNQVLKGLDRDNLEGKRINFMGCFTDNQDKIILTPVFIEVYPGDQ